MMILGLGRMEMGFAIGRWKRCWGMEWLPEMNRATTDCKFYASELVLVVSVHNSVPHFC